MPQRGNGQTPIEPDRRLIPLRWPTDTSVGSILGWRAVRGIVLPLLAVFLLLLLPLAGGGFDIKTTNMNQLLESYGARALSGTANDGR